MKPDKENSTGLSSDHAKLPETKCISDITGNPCDIAQTLHDQWALVRLLSFCHAGIDTNTGPPARGQ